MFLENIFFPRFCVGCSKEGSFLCEDCFFLIEVMERVYCLCEEPRTGIEKCKNCSSFLDGLYSSCFLKGALVENIFKKYTKEPFLKDLSYPLAGLVIRYFLSIKEDPDLSCYRLVSLPVTNKKKAGYDINEEIAEKIKKPLGINSSGEKILLFSVLYTEEMEREAEKLKKEGFSVKGLSVFRK